jgi:copper chaperone CopZ
MTQHTVTISFDDDKLSVDQVVQALNGAGYSVPSYTETD